MNSCLDRVSELIAAGTTNQITGEDLAIVQKLQAEFATELSVLRGRVDALDARTAQLEANQFSTATKLNAEIIVVVTDTSGNSVGDSRDRTNTIVANRGRLNFETSFTGRDMLRTPGVWAVVNPENESRNDTQWVWLLRTGFNF